MITTFHFNFILSCNALFLAPFGDEIYIIYFVPCTCMCFTLMYLAVVLLELRISVFAFVNRIAFIKLPYIYVCVDYFHVLLG